MSSRIWYCVSCWIWIDVPQKSRLQRQGRWSTFKVLSPCCIQVSRICYIQVLYCCRQVSLYSGVIYCVRAYLYVTVVCKQYLTTVIKITCQGTAYIQQLHISKPVHNIWHLNIVTPVYNNITPEYNRYVTSVYNNLTWRWRQQVSLKRPQSSIILYGIASQKTVIPVVTVVGKLRPLFMNPVVKWSCYSLTK